MAEDQNQFLPPCEGPKLAPFVFANPAARGLTLLGYLGSGDDSFVFWYEIEGAEYAVKVFKPARAQPYFDRVMQCLPEVDATMFSHHTDPFFAECRAFGRLKESGREDLAIKCHGHLTLTEDECLNLRDQIDWIGPVPAELAHRPLRAIVKAVAYGEPEPPFEPRMVKGMLRRVRQINALGISITDVHREQFHDDVLLDLSRARTAPHWQFDLTGRYWPVDQTHLVAAIDFVRFDRMVEDYEAVYGRTIWDRFYTNEAYLARLRRAPRVQEADYKRLKPPTMYDWRNPPIPRQRGAVGKQGSKKKTKKEMARRRRR